MMNWEIVLMSGVTEAQANDIATAMIQKCGDIAATMPASSDLSRAFTGIMNFVTILASKDSRKGGVVEREMEKFFEFADTIGRDSIEGHLLMKTCVKTLARAVADANVFRIKVDKDFMDSVPILTVLYRQLGWVKAVEY